MNHKGNLIASVAALTLIAAGSTGALAATATNSSQPQATAPASQAGTIPASSVTNAKSMLSGVKIMGPDDKSVGSVDDIALDANGKAMTFKVDVGGFLGIGTKDVAMNANELKFDPMRKVLLTTMTEDQIKALPAFKG